MCIWMFWITLSHFKEITWIFVYDGCHNHFWRKYFRVLFCFVIIDWWQSQLGWVHIWGGGRENKMSKDESGLSVIEMMCGDSMQLNLLDKVYDDNIHWWLFPLENMMMGASKYLSISKCKKWEVRKLYSNQFQKLSNCNVNWVSLGMMIVLQLSS